jgi:AraC-like DNA-binding protein
MREGGQGGEGGGTVSVVLVRPLVLALLARDIGPRALEDFYSASDLTPEILADAEARVSAAQFCVAWGTAIELAHDRELALSIAEGMPSGAFGIVEYICRSASTVRGALVQWCRYLSILDGAVKVELVDLGGPAAFRVTRESHAPAPASHELCFAVLVRHARAMLAEPLRVSRVRFAHEGSGELLTRYRAFFNAPVEFGSAVTEIVFDERELGKPLLSSDANLLAILQPSAEQALAKGRVTAPLTDQVRRSLEGALREDDAQLESVAKRLGMTGRSLQRRLKDEGTAFQTLRDETRKRLADRYLGQGLTFAEISFLLGFSEPSAFFRAFKRWTGLTPYERRAALSAT